MKRGGYVIGRSEKGRHRDLWLWNLYVFDSRDLQRRRRRRAQVMGVRRTGQFRSLVVGRYIALRRCAVIVCQPFVIVPNACVFVRMDLDQRNPGRDHGKQQDDKNRPLSRCRNIAQGQHGRQQCHRL